MCWSASLSLTGDRHASSRNWSARAPSCRSTSSPKKCSVASASTRRPGRHDVERVRRVKIVATLGPATDGLELDLVRAGLDVARLNFSHGIASDHARRCAAVRDAARQVGRSVAVMQDLQGPKIRVGSLVGGGPVQLSPGQELVITTHDTVGTGERNSCTYE